MDDDILDDGLRLALAFGPHWREPIQPRLATMHPDLDASALDRYDAHCRQVRDRAQARVAELAAEAGDPDAVFDTWANEIRKAHPWISDENLTHLWSQARYYIYKGG